MNNTTYSPPADIRVLQINAHRSPDVNYAILHEATNLFDIIFMQEPWYGQIGLDDTLVGPKAHHDWQPIPAVDPLPPNRHPRVITYVSKHRTDFTTIHRADLALDLDIQFIELAKPGQPPILVGNIYNQKESDDSNVWTFDRLHQLAPFAPNQAVTLLGDWNVHHHWWTNIVSDNRPRARELAEWLTERDFQLLNTPGEATFHANGRASSVIDLTFVSPAVVQANTVRDWAINPDAACGSDHHSISFVIDGGTHPIDNPFGKKYLWKKAEPQDFKKALLTSLRTHKHRLDEILNHPSPNEAELEWAAERVQDCLEEAATLTVPVRRSSPHAKGWWTPHL